jgi:hypothetical protein
MKKMLFAILLLTWLHPHAQIAPSFDAMYSTMAEYHRSEVNNFIEYDDSGKVISIYGDTVKLIESLLRHTHSLDSVQTEYYKFMQASAKFINCLPDYYKDGKNNRSWVKLWAIMQRNGYGYITQKSTDNCCK